MRDIVARLEIKEFCKIVITLPGQFTDIPHEFRLAYFPVRGHIDFGAVTGRKNQLFVKRGLFERSRFHVHRDIELLADGDFGHLVAHAGHIDFAHGPKIEKIC